MMLKLVVKGVGNHYEEIITHRQGWKKPRFF